jgi:hypothetical protein
MVLKASILLLFLLLPLQGRAVPRKDPTETLRALEARRGQSLEHDLELARTYLFLEKRQEALRLLSTLGRDERVRTLLSTAGSLFFSQETADLHYEGVRWLGVGKIQEARDRFAQALAKEPGHLLLLTRLVACDLLLGHKDQARLRWLEARALAPPGRELRILGFKLLLENAFLPGDDERSGVATKAELIGEEVPASFYVEHLVKNARWPELRGLLRDWLGKHPDWSLPFSRIDKETPVPPELRKKIRAQLEKNLKDRARFESHGERELRQGRYLWAGFVRYEELVKKIQ